MYLSTLTILLIAIDRYRQVVFPLSRPMSLANAHALIVLSLAVSLILGIPVVAFTTVHAVDDVDLHLHRFYCVEVWPDDVARVAYAALTFTLQFCLPLVVSGALYWRIYCRLRRRPSRGRVTNCRRLVPHAVFETGRDGTTDAAKLRFHVGGRRENGNYNF